LNPVPLVASSDSVLNVQGKPQLSFLRRFRSGFDDTKSLATKLRCFPVSLSRMLISQLSFTDERSDVTESYPVVISVSSEAKSS